MNGAEVYKSHHTIFDNNVWRFTLHFNTDQDTAYSNTPCKQVQPFSRKDTSVLYFFATLHLFRKTFNTLPLLQIAGAINVDVFGLVRLTEQSLS